MSSRSLAAVSIPRSPTRTTVVRPNRSLSLPTCAATVLGSPVLPLNTSIATGMPSLLVSSPYTIWSRPRTPSLGSPLGAIGHHKDGVRGRLQIVYGLLTSKDGIPVAIEVFKGNTGDPKTVAAQVGKVKDRFGLTTVVLAGDRGMLTAARLREDIRPAALDWITALRAPQVKALV